MNLFEKVNQDIKQAMRDRNKERLEALRAIKAAFLLAKTEKGDDELSPEKELAIVQKLAKQRIDSAKIYKENNRLELYEVEMAQAKVIQEYLPKSMTDEELKTYLMELIAKVGATGMKDMGKVMGTATKELAGKADGSRISAIVKEILG
ncbi:MAG: GatB/YqeY domain-containing protein [Candidatus Zixiibacteriota bacterium]|nr:MAG: GatB/YqeY domain-containing protein [candidate division Zixibacteria bacterium]